MIITETFFRKILSRIETIRNNEGFKKRSHFTKTINYSNSNYNSLVQGKSSKPSLDLVICVHQRFINYNIAWILYGLDPMLNSSTSQDALYSPSIIDIEENFKNLIQSQHNSILQLTQTLNHERETIRHLSKILNEKHISY